MKLTEPLKRYFGDYWPLVFIYGGGFLVVALFVALVVVVDAFR